MKSAVPDCSDRFLLLRRGASPVSFPIVFQELAPDVFTRIEAEDDWIDDTRRAIHDIQRRMESMLGEFAGGMTWGSSSVNHPVSSGGHTRQELPVVCNRLQEVRCRFQPLREIRRALFAVMGFHRCAA